MDQQPEQGKPDVPELLLQTEQNSVSRELQAKNLTSLEDLVRFAYSQKGKRLLVPARVFEVISKGFQTQPPGMELLSELRRLAEADPLLSVPPRVLASTQNAAARLPVKTAVVNMVAAVMQDHPTFRPDVLSKALQDPPSDPDECFRSLHETCKRVTPADLGLPEIKVRDRDQLRTNATMALALLLCLRDRWDLSQLVDCFHRHLWRAAGRDSGSRWALLAEARSPDALRLVADVYLARLEAAEKRSGAAEDYSRRETERAFAADAARERAEHELKTQIELTEQLSSRVSQFVVALETARRDREADRVHHVSDFDRLRTRIVRMLEEQKDLLSDGLHALRSGRSNITDEYLERVLDAQVRHLNELRNEGGQP